MGNAFHAGRRGGPSKQVGYTAKRVQLRGQYKSLHTSHCQAATINSPVVHAPRRCMHAPIYALSTQSVVR